MSHEIDHYSFIYGMTTAFAECVSREAKRLALSPPFPPRYTPGIEEEISNICAENGISCWFDTNEDLPESSRVCWYVLYKFPEALEAYRKLRDCGHNPALQFEAFFDILDYGRAWAAGHENLRPVFRETRNTGDTPGRVLFPDGGWPPAV